jgi:hypothetical protein
MATAGFLSASASIDLARSLDTCQPLPSTSQSLLCAVESLIQSSEQQSLHIAGDAGSGKSLFIRRVLQSLLESQHAAGTPKLGLRAALECPVAMLPGDTFPLLLPVVIELKKYSVSELRGRLPSFLVESLGLSREVVDAVRTQSADQPKVRLVVLCDGVDELQGDMTELGDFTATLCGGPGSAWAPSILKVIATSRERVAPLLFQHSDGPRPSHLTLLPLTRAQVRGNVSGSS